jgi:hypothetical protein
VTSEQRSATPTPESVFRTVALNRQERCVRQTPLES